MDPSGPEQPGAEQPGPEQPGAEQAGAEQAGAGRLGPAEPGPGSAVPDGSGMAGSERAGSERTGPDPSASHPAGVTALPDRVRRRLDEVFGDVLPEVTRDEVDGTPHDPTAADGDRWLRANRPPHHDGRT